jgi:hypothetical protein
MYEVTTNQNSYIYKVQYIANRLKRFYLVFSFTDSELEEIIKIRHENNKKKELIFAFICGQKQLSDYNQVIAIVYWNEFIECVDIEKEQIRGTARLSVKAVKGSPWLRIYGSKRADMLGGKDNTIKIERNRLGNL